MKKNLVIFSLIAMTQWSTLFANVTFGNTIIDVSATGEQVEQPQVGADDNGNAISVWINGGDVQARRLDSSGNINPIVDLCGSR